MHASRGFLRPAELEEIGCTRTRRLAAELLGVVGPTLAIQPPCRDNVYIVLDAVAWAAATVLASTEDRDALDFFTLALTQNLDQLEARDSGEGAAEVLNLVPPKASQKSSSEAA